MGRGNLPASVEIATGKKRSPAKTQYSFSFSGFFLGNFSHEKQFSGR
jgi:hypothetical protein